MDCQHVQQLLAFVDRKCEGLDETERDLIRQHLESCPACVELAQAERGADEALGAVLRDVSVPADLKQKVMSRLAAERGGVPWRQTIAAAAILIAMASGLAWFFRPPPEVNLSDVESVFTINRIGNWDEDAAKEYLKQQGLTDRVPGQFDYRYLQHVDVIEFKGRPVAKLTFSKANDCTAFVLILPWKQFRTNELHDDATSVKILRNDEHKLTYLILYRGNLDALRAEQSIF